MAPKPEKEEPFYVPVDNRNYVPDGVPYLQGFVPNHLGGTEDDKVMVGIRTSAVAEADNENSPAHEYGPYSDKDFDDEPHEELDVDTIDSARTIEAVITSQQSEGAVTPKESRAAVKKQGAAQEK